MKRLKLILKGRKKAYKIPKEMRKRLKKKQSKLC